jgi:hypothetical protein
LTHVRNLLREDADVQATFNALRKPRKEVWIFKDPKTGERERAESKK